MTKEEIFEKVRDIISERCKIDKNSINLDSDFELDLQLDSLDIVEITMKIEEEFNININDEDVMRMRKISDVVDYIYDNKKS